MALRLQGDFFGRDGTEYTVSVYVDGYVGAVSDFLANSLEISWEGDDGDLHAPIMASTARVGVSINSTTVQNAFTELKSAKEGDYILKIDREGELYWVGYIIPDNVTVQDAKQPYTFEIRATDAIGRLKDIDYTGTGLEWDGWQTILQHIYNVLSFMPFSDFWDVGERYFSAHNNMYALFQVQATNISPLPNTRLQHRAFKSIDREGAVKYKSVYFVLEEITRAFGCRFYLAAGRYRMEQITRYASEAANITIKSWDKAGTATADEVLDSWAGRVLDVNRSDLRLDGLADATKFSGGVITYLPALKEVQATYKHFSTQYVSPIVNRWTEGGAEVAEIDDIEAGGGDFRLYLSIYLQFLLMYSSTSSYSARPKFRALITMTDGATTWYLKREAVYNFGVVSYLPAEWLETTAYYEFFAPSTVVLFPVIANQAIFSGIINIESAPLPIDGDLSISFEYVELRGTEDVVPSGVITSYDWEMVLQSCDIRPTGIVDARTQATRYYAYNTEGNSEVYSLELTIGDGPTLNTFGRFQRWDGTAWRPTGSWKDLGSDDDYPHAAYIAREILFPRQRPSEKLEGALVGVLPPIYILERSGTRYIPMRVKIDLGEGTSDGVWAFISRVSELETVPDTGVELEVIDAPSQFTPIQPAPSAGLLNEAVDRMTLDANGAFWMQTGLVAAAGATTTVNAQSRDYIHPFFDGDDLVVIDPGNGLTQPIRVDTTTETDKTITVESFTPIADFPIGSIIAPGDTFMLRLLTKLRRQTLTFNLLPYYLDVPADAGTTFDAFWRVPNWMDGYLISRIEANYRTAGEADERQIGTYKNGSFLASAIITAGQIRAGVTLGAYNEIAAGDLLDWRIVSATAGTKYPKGLTINIQIIATL